MTVHLTPESIGREYRTRGGYTARIEGYRHSDVAFPYSATVTYSDGIKRHETYTVKGSAWQTCGSDDDLVELLPEIPVDRPEPSRLAMVAADLHAAQAKIHGLEIDLEELAEECATACEMADEYRVQATAWQAAHQQLAHSIANGQLAGTIAQQLADQLQPKPIKVEPVKPVLNTGKLQKAFADSGVYGVSLVQAMEIMQRLGIKVEV